MNHPEASLVVALALGSAVAAQTLARHLRIPSIVPLLAFGVLLGPDGLDWIVAEALGEGLFHLVSLSVAIILFEGGLNLELRRLRREAGTIRRLITVGAAVTAAGGTFAAHWLMGWGWGLSAVFGTLVIVSGPTVIKPLLRILPLRTRLATVLEAEGVLIDPVGAIVAAVTLQIVLGPSAESFASALSNLGLGLAFGSIAGAVFGLGLGLLLRPSGLVPEGMENILTLGLVLVLFEGCEHFVPESGILAVTVAGVFVGNAGAHVDRKLGEFEETLTVGLVGILFVLLAASVRLDDVLALGRAGLLTVAALVFIVRPLNVWVSTVGSELNGRERVFLAWIAPRGIVAAAVASLFAAVLLGRGAEGGTELRALVFLTIAVTVVLQGLTAPLVARALGVRVPGRETIVILGAEETGLALGRVLREGGRVVAFVDANPRHCSAAQAQDFPVTYGNALEERTLARARVERAQAVVGLTPNDEVNILFAREAREFFGVRESYVALGRSGGKVTSGILERQESRVLFDRPKDVERWSVRFRHGAARIERLRFVGVPEDVEKKEDEPASQDAYVMLAFQRGKEWSPMYAALEPKRDDVVAVAIHAPDAERAQEALTAAGWVPVPPEAEPEREPEPEREAAAEPAS